MTLAGNVLPATLSSFDTGSHGFTAGANTTVALSTTDKLDGTTSLRPAATAAGSITLTSVRFAVSASTAYEISVPMRCAQAATGRVAIVTVTWYSAMSGGSSLGTSARTQPLSDTTPWVPDAYPVVLATAPAGAAAATITIVVSGLGAGHALYIDQLEFAPAVLLSGNLLGYSAQGIEAGTGDWIVSGPATLARYSGTFEPGTGSYTLAVVSGGAGVITYGTGAAFPVVAGTEYVAFMSAYTTTASGNITASLAWYSAADVLLSTSSATNPIIVGATLFPTAIGRAPAGATKARIQFSFTATGSGQVIQADQAYVAVAPNRAGNLLGYAEYSQETTVAHWITTDCTVERVRIGLTDSEGWHMTRVTPAAVGPFRLDLDSMVPVSPGTYYEAQAMVFRHNTSVEEVSHTVTTCLDWYDASGALLQVGTPPVAIRQISAGVYYGGFARETYLAPAGAAFAKIVIRITHESPLADVYYVDCVSIRSSTPIYTLAVDNTTGMVALTVNGIPDASVTQYSVQRFNEDGSAEFIRAYDGETNRLPYTPGTMVFEDYEAPLGTRIWYHVTFHVPPPSIEAIVTRVIDAPIVPDSDYVWVKSPGIPALNTIVMVESAIEWDRAARSTAVAIVGRKLPVPISEVRAGGTASLSLLIWDEGAHVLFDSLMDSGLPILIQAMPGYGVKGNLYLTVGDIGSSPVMGAADEPGWRWTLAVTEIDRPSGGLQGSAGATWEDVLGFASWIDVMDGHETWAEVLLGGA